MKLFKFLLKESKLPLIGATILSMIAGASASSLAIILHRTIEPAYQASTYFAWYFMGAVLVFMVSNVSSRLPLFYLSEDVTFKLRTKLIRNILHSRLRFLEEMGSHKLHAVLNEDIARVSNGIVQVPQLIVNASILAGCLIYLSILSWQVLIALALFLGILIAIFQFAATHATKRFSTSRESSDAFFEQVRAATEGTKELKLNRARRHQYFNELLNPAAQEYRSQRVIGLLNFEIANTFANLCYFSLMGFLAFVLPHFQDIGQATVSGGVLMLLFMLGPLANVLALLPILSQVTVAFKKIDSLGLDLSRHFEAEERNEEPNPNWQRIELKSVCHTYYNEQKDEQFTLGPIDMDLKPGEIVFLVGGNGSGKSTLAKLLTGLYKPESGSIHLDGKEIGEDDLEGYYQNFSAIFSDFFLFEKLLGINPDLIKEYGGYYLPALHLEHKVTLTEDRLSNIKLSGGQRKRLALLASILEDRPICVFDEWASDQDPVFKRIFYEKMLPHLRDKGKAILAITHDDQYFHLCDRMIKLADGKIITQQDSEEGVPAP